MRHHLTCSRSLQGADEAYRRMQAAGFPPDGATFAALLDTVQHWASLDGEWFRPRLEGGQAHAGKVVS